MGALFYTPFFAHKILLNALGRCFGPKLTKRVCKFSAGMRNVLLAPLAMTSNLAGQLPREVSTKRSETSPPSITLL